MAGLRAVQGYLLRTQSSFRSPGEPRAVLPSSNPTIHCVPNESLSGECNTELSCPADSPTAEALQPIRGPPPLEPNTQLRGQLQRLVMRADISGNTGDRAPWRVLCAQNSSNQDQAIAKRRGTSADGQGFFTQEISSRTSSHDHRLSTADENCTFVAVENCTLRPLELCTSRTLPSGDK